jgi:hypothetical protein
VVTGAALLFFGFRRPLELLLVPLIILTGWAFIGHLVTLDDDFPGGWSNPAGSRRFLGSSLLELLVKGIIFAGISTLAALLLR